MPIIRITEADIQRNKVLDPGWYTLEVMKVEDLVAAKTGTSSNLWITFKIDGTDGKEIRHNYNSMMFNEMVSLYEAVEGQKMTGTTEFDPADWVGKKADNKLETKVYEGRISNDVTPSWLPAGQGKNQKSPF